MLKRTTNMSTSARTHDGGNLLSAKFLKEFIGCEVLDTSCRFSQMSNVCVSCFESELSLPVRSIMLSEYTARDTENCDETSKVHGRICRENSRE